MKVLQLTCHFQPNVGGVETHLNDLVSELVKRKYEVFVLTYRPLMSDAEWKITEKKKSLTIIRIPWIKGYFYRFVKSPVLEFIYLFPGLFAVLPFVLLFNKFDVIHTHGLVAGFVGVFWGRIFGIKVITTTHSIYTFPQTGLYMKFARWIFKGSYHILTLSKQSKIEIEKLGINSDMITVFTYWIDLNKFKSKKSKVKSKEDIEWKDKFVVLFVGRLIEEKGVLVLLEAAKRWNKKINIALAGEGPLREKILDQKSEIKNLIYLGKIDNNDLPKYYSAADLVIVPSINEEGFGRVIIESLACGTPVVGSNRGAIPEAMDKSVGRLIDVSEQNIINEIEYLFYNTKTLGNLSDNSRAFSEKKYSNKNVDLITRYYL